MLNKEMMHLCARFPLNNSFDDFWVGVKCQMAKLKIVFWAFFWGEGGSYLGSGNITFATKKLSTYQILLYVLTPTKYFFYNKNHCA